MSIGVRLSSGGRMSNIARKPLIDCSGRADGTSIVPREIVMIGSTFVLFAKADSSPPAKSTANRHEKERRCWPTTPPSPVRVATVCASGGAACRRVPQERPVVRFLLRAS